MKFLPAMTIMLIFLLAACGGDDDNDVVASTTSDAEPTPVVVVTQGEEDILSEVQARGVLRCGVQDALPGFGFQNEAGEFVGLDTDVCRVLAAAIFGTHDQVEFVPLTTSERFPALAAGDIDVLIRNSTFNLSRDAENGLDFGPIVFYDGQGVLVRRGEGIFELNDLNEARVCVQPDTTTQPNFAETMRVLDLTYEEVSVTDQRDGVEKLVAGDCDAFTADRSALVSQQASHEDPTEFAVLEVVLSQEPLAPVYREGDARWGNVIRWSIYGIIHAERLGITSENIDDFRNSGIQEIELLLGEQGNLGNKLGLQNSFVAQAVAQVGNYGEIYAENLGSESVIGLARGQNALWTAGGLVYAPPFR
jgi:general L-amino acid transport system substrate-binding protein